jgi:hypothetical protein
VSGEPSDTSSDGSLLSETVLDSSKLAWWSRLPTVDSRPLNAVRCPSDQRHGAACLGSVTNGAHPGAVRPWPVRR